jgi:acyl dehydratase
MYLDDFKVGDRFRIPSCAMTDAHFMFFSGMTGDNHSVYCYENYYKQMGFSGRLARGLMLAGMTALGVSEPVRPHGELGGGICGAVRPVFETSANRRYSESGARG